MNMTSMGSNRGAFSESGVNGIECVGKTVGVLMGVNVGGSVVRGVAVTVLVRVWIGVKKA
jgi:hypothetical protein